MKKKSKRNKRNKRKTIILIAIIILLLVIISFLGYYYFCIYKKGVNYKTKITIEIGENLPTIKDYVYEEDLDRVGKEIVWKNIETIENKIYKLGEYDGSFEFRDETLNIKLVVKDTIPPVIEGIKDIEMIAYESVPNLLEGVTVSDNSKEDIEVTLDGQYDTDKIGEYTLTYIATDSSGNEKKETTKLVVKENPNIKISKTSKGNILKYNYGITYIDGAIIANKTYGLPSNYVPSNLVSINGYIKVVDYVKTAFNELVSDSTALGLNIYASSGYRSYSDQKYIYNNYVSYDGMANADTYSARAGHSEHQTGLAIDVNSVDSSFDGTDESNWLKDNCYKYGFIIRYPKGKDSITGYMYEPWHIRYVGKDLATTLYNNGSWLTIEEYYGIDSKYK